MDGSGAFGNWHQTAGGDMPTFLRHVFPIWNHPLAMDQLAEHNDTILHRKDRFDEKGDLSELAVPIISADGVLDVSTTPEQPYRLYKRRWIGVFAMVRTAFSMTYLT